MGGYCSLRCGGCFCCRSTGSRRGGLSSCGVQTYGLWRMGFVLPWHVNLPGPGGQCPLHPQADSYPQDRLGGPSTIFFLIVTLLHLHLPSLIHSKSSRAGPARPSVRHRYFATSGPLYTLLPLPVMVFP